MLAAAIVAPGHGRVLPLMPEFVANVDGAEKQDCERNAAKRWLAAHGGRVKPLRPVYLGDGLFACQPIGQAALDAGGDILFTAKPDSHKTLYDFMAGARIEESTLTRKDGGKKLNHRHRWFCAAPLRSFDHGSGGKDALSVNWIGLTIFDAKGKATYENACVTSLPVSKETVAEIAACARARWKVENETFNVLKNNGCHLEHNFGHGKQNLAKTFAAMNLLAFAFHTICDCLEAAWTQARGQARPKTLLPAHRDDNRLSRLSRLGHSHGNPHQIQTPARNRRANHNVIHDGRGLFRIAGDGAIRSCCVVVGCTTARIPATTRCMPCARCRRRFPRPRTRLRLSRSTMRGAASCRKSRPVHRRIAIRNHRRRPAEACR